MRVWKADAQLECLHRIYRGKRDRESQCCVCLTDLNEPNRLCPTDENETQCRYFCGSMYEPTFLEYKACIQRYNLNVLSCGHELCEKCKLAMLQRGETKCPLCRQDTLINSYTELGLSQNFSSSLSSQASDSKHALSLPCL